MSSRAEQDTDHRGAGAPPPSQRAALASRVLALIRRNALGEAETILARELSANRDDPAFLYLAGTVCALRRQAEEAESLYRRSLAVQAAQAHVHRDLGKLLVSQNRLDEGIAELREAIRLGPGDVRSHLALAAGHARHGDHVQARERYGEVLGRDPGNASARLGLAEALCHLDRPREAESVLRQALADGTANSRAAAAIAYGLGRALQQQKNFEQALAQFDAAQRILPDFSAADLARAETLQQIGRWEESAQSFRKVLARDPDHWNARATLALLCALLGDFAEARALGAKAFAIGPPHPIASIALALCEIEAGEAEKGEKRVRDLLEDPAHANEQGAAFAAGFVADALDRHGCWRAAFATAAASKSLLRKLWAPPPTRITGMTEERTAFLASSEVRLVAADAPKRDGEPATHVFVLGFPRSGTTLLETVLAADAQVVHAHELDFLAEAEREFLATPKGLARLFAAGESTIAVWRDHYWKAVHQADFQAAGKIFVDKMPVNTFRLPLIARLFPSAKIIFVHRDPRDVVLSCFRHHFDPTPYSYEFLNLEDCAGLYGAAMQFAETSRRKVLPCILDVRYEDCVADFEGTIRGVCEFAGIPWSETLRDFAQAAQSIDLRSASARQVRRGLYADAVGHWRHYREQLAPVLPLLAPWAAHFGYPID